MGANQITRGTPAPMVRTHWQEETDRRLQSLEEVSNEILRRLHPRGPAADERADAPRPGTRGLRFDSKLDPPEKAFGPSDPPPVPAMARALTRLEALCDSLHKQLTDLSDQLTPVLGSPLPQAADMAGTSQGPVGNSSIVQALWTIGDRLELSVAHAAQVQRRLEI